MSAHLTDGVVTLRPFQAGDTDAVFEAVDESRTALGRWMDWCHPGYAMTDAQDWIDRQPGLREKGDLPLAICDAATGRLLGASGLDDIHPVHRFANLGYWVRTSEIGAGVATRAARLAAIAGLDLLGLPRIEIVVEVGNHASRRVAEKVGASLEAVGRHRLARGDGPRDAFMFSLVVDDLERLRAEASAASSGGVTLELGDG